MYASAVAAARAGTPAGLSQVFGFVFGRRHCMIMASKVELLTAPKEIITAAAAKSALMRETMSSWMSVSSDLCLATS